MIKFVGSVSRIYELVGGRAALRNSDNLRMPARESIKKARIIWERKDAARLARLSDTGHDPE